MKINLLHILGILSIILFVEIIFLICITKTNSKLNIETYIQKDNKIINSNNIKQKNFEEINGFAIDHKLLDSLLISSKNIKKGVLKSYKILASFEGTIKKLEWNDEETNNKNLRLPQLSFVIEGNNGNTHQFGIPKFSNKEIIIINVSDRKGNKKDLRSLNIGDKIKLTIDMDLTNSNDGQFITNWNIVILSN